MRTTIEIRDDQRARLLELAARRGEKGFSTLVQEALDHYLNALHAADGRVEQAIEAIGSLDPEAATQVENRAAAFREDTG